ncbi:MAG: hypothetical protein M3N24_00865, partial [Actinomycetota bacterium]|nr:hypothetical protein [Actinomycetota bacterium]
MRHSVLLLLPLALTLALEADSAGAAQGSEDAGAIVHVVKVQGVIDPALSGFVRDVLADARTNSTVVLQMDSRWGYDEHPEELARDIRDARVPVVAWIGPSGARVEGPAIAVVGSTALQAVAPGAGVG